MHRRLILLVLLGLAPALGQTADRAAVFGIAHLAGGARWECAAPEPELFLPPLGAVEGELILEPEVDHLLDVGQFRRNLRVEGRLDESSTGRLEVALFTDEERGRGLLIQLAAGGDRARVEVRHLLPRGSRVLASAARGPRGEAPVRFLVEVARDRLQLSMAGLPLLGETGLDVRKVGQTGRLVLAAREAPLVLSALSLRGELSTAAQERLRLRAAARVPELPALPAITFADPLSLVPEDALVAGLDQDAARALRKLHLPAAQGRGLEVLAEVEALAKQLPEAPGPAFLAGAIRLVHGGDARGARPLLERGSSIPGAASLLADACRMLGDLDAARRQAAAVVAPHDARSHRALLAWVDAQRPSGISVEAVGELSCRRCARRTLLLANLEALVATPGLHRHAARGVTVLSDASRARARLLHRHATAFLRAAPSELGGRPAARPLTLVVLGSPVLYDFWNERLGGAHHADTVGVYRPGTGVVILHDDEDDALTRRWLQHELVHHLVHERALALPLGLEEGLAEYLAMGAPRGARLVGLERLSRGHLETAARLAALSGLQPAADLFFCDPVGAGPLVRDTYAQGWLALHFAAHADDSAGRAWWRACAAALARGDAAGVDALRGTAPGPEALRRHLRSLGWDRD